MATYERVKVPEGQDVKDFRAALCSNFSNKAGNDGATIIRASIDSSYKDNSVLCLRVQGRPNQSQSDYLRAHAF